VGAAAYSPAKYGILSELTSSDNLVKANGLIESSTIAAILIGAVAGGTLADFSVRGAVIAVALCYALAAVSNLFIPSIPAAKAWSDFSWRNSLRDFVHAVRRLFAVRDARFSVIGTSLFWGAGSTMRFLLIAWVPVALGISNNRMPAYLNAMVAIGIVIGAALAAKYVTLHKVDRALGGGICLGLAVCLLSLTSQVPVAFAILAIVGAGGGFFVVPLNALLQERGGASVGSGQAIAIQNLVENSAMLVMIGAYMLIMRAGASVTWVSVGFGAALSLSIAALWLARRRWRRAIATTAEAVGSVNVARAGLGISE
jgi:LPLT family lysophospholipid transporter-like MFS transporter